MNTKYSENPNNLMAIFMEGRLALVRNQLDQAIQSFRKVIQDNPVSAQAHYFLGVAHNRNSEFEQAKTELYAALKYMTSSG